MTWSPVISLRLDFHRYREKKCLRKSNLWRYRAENVFGSIISIRLDHQGYQPTTSTQGMFSFHDVWNVLFHLSLSYLWSFVRCGVFSLCNLLLSVSQAVPLTLKNWSMTFGVSGHFYVWTSSLIRLSIIERISFSVKCKTDKEA